MKYLTSIMAIMMLMGCSSKIVSYDAMGNKHIIEKDVVLVEPYMPKE